MANERNALAELAEGMKGRLAYLEENTAPYWVKIYGKAQRIIAELSHVSDIPYQGVTGPVYRPHRIEAGEAIIKCRAIAEEGAGDGVKSP